MTALERKLNSEKILLSLGITLRDELPPIEEESAVQLRSPQEIAQRILILTYLNCVATDPSLRQEVMMFLIHEKLWSHVTETEKDLFHKAELSEAELSTILWRAESIWLLLWTIDKVETLEPPVEEVNLHEIFPLLPGFFEPTQEFIAAATMKPVSEVLNQADFIFRLNWGLREADMQGSPLTQFNASIAHERYFAINWVTRMHKEWEEQ